MYVYATTKSAIKSLFVGTTQARLAFWNVFPDHSYVLHNVVRVANNAATLNTTVTTVCARVILARSLSLSLSHMSQHMQQRVGIAAMVFHAARSSSRTCLQHTAAAGIWRVSPILQVLGPK
jgi:hypothetical protein